ncbi:MAG TPA: DUF397 domain-containing protein [Micromonosporaceae bacterium]|nr:DUF397 domain-containing protein [Micromonosporaceae bacterium]
MTTPDDSAIWWCKSRRSTSQGSCVEVAFGDGCVLVRDSKDPGGVRLRFSRSEWLAFVRAVRDDQFLPS